VPLVRRALVQLGVEHAAAGRRPDLLERVAAIGVGDEVHPPGHARVTAPRESVLLRLDHQLWTPEAFASVDGSGTLTTCTSSSSLSCWPFLKPLMPCPIDLPSLGSRVAPKSSRTTSAMMISSGAPRFGMGAPFVAGVGMRLWTS